MATNSDKLKMILLKLSEDPTYKELLDYISMLQTLKMQCELDGTGPQSVILYQMKQWLDTEIK